LFTFSYASLFLSLKKQYYFSEYFRNGKKYRKGQNFGLEKLAQNCFLLAIVYVHDREQTKTELYLKKIRPQKGSAIIERKSDDQNDTSQGRYTR